MKHIWKGALLAAAVLAGSLTVSAAPALIDGKMAAAGEGASVRTVAFQRDMELPEAGKTDFHYPEVTKGSALYRARVNGAVVAEAQRFLGGIVRQREKGAKVSAWVTWQEGMASDNLRSFVLVESQYYDRAAHPMSYVQGMTFKEDGSRFTFSDLMALRPDINAEFLSKRIMEENGKNNLFLFPEVKGVSRVPHNFYIGTDGHVYFLFQQYEIAPYAAGWIAIDAGPLMK